MHKLDRTLSLCCFLSWFSSSVSGYLVGIRSTVSTPSTIDIPLSLDSAGRYVAQVAMSTGSKQQPFGFALSTSTGYNVVAGVGCSSCNTTAAYNASASSSATAIGMVNNVTLPGGYANGVSVREDCSLQTVSGTPWAYPNQTVIVANQSNAVFSSEVSGLLGLGTNSRNGSFADTIFGGWLSRNPTQNSFSYGMALQNPQATPVSGGVLHWLAADASFYQGDVVWKNASASALSDWTVPFDGWSLDIAGFNISRNNDRSLQAAIDPYFPNIYLPQNESRVLYASIPEATIRVSPAGSTTNSWLVPCSTKLTFAATFGSLTIDLDEKVLLVTQADGSCVSTIEGWTDPNVAEYLFGSSVIGAMYLIFTISVVQGAIGFASRAVGKHSLSTGALVGIIIGCVAAGIAIAAVSLLVYRQWKKWPVRPRRRKLGAVDPFTLVSRPPQENERVPLMAPTHSSSSSSWSAYQHRTPIEPPSPVSVVLSGDLLRPPPTLSDLRTPNTASSRDVIFDADDHTQRSPVVFNGKQSRNRASASTNRYSERSDTQRPGSTRPDTPPPEYS